MTTQQATDRIQSMAYSASKDWYRRQCRNVYASMYFYYKPGTVGDMDFGFYIGESKLNDGWILAWNERISPAKTQPQVENQLIEIARTLPIL